MGKKPTNRQKWEQFKSNLERKKIAFPDRGLKKRRKKSFSRRGAYEGIEVIVILLFLGFMLFISYLIFVWIIESDLPLWLKWLLAGLA